MKVMTNTNSNRKKSTTQRLKLLTRLVFFGIVIGLSSNAIKRRSLNYKQTIAEFEEPSITNKKQYYSDVVANEQEQQQKQQHSSNEFHSNYHHHHHSERENWWHDLSSKCQFKLGQKIAPFGELKDVDARSELYSNMYRSTKDTIILDIFNPSKTVIVQSANNNNDLTLDKVFDIDTEKDVVTPILEKLEIPVRAIVLPFPSSSDGAKIIGKTTREILSKYGFAKETSVWLQNAELYHASVYHASHHLDPRKVKISEIKEEIRAVKESAKQICSIKIVLERVVVTTSGALVSVWNTQNSNDVGEISEFRKLLLNNLPHSPVNQIVSNKSIVHATLARFLGTVGTSENAKMVARELTNSLCGLEMTLPIAWFVEERHTLALALGGEYDTVGAPFRDCRSD
jgi:hypothetical protein